MFEVGFTEIVLILGIALLVLGPEKLPRLANQFGRWLGRARAMARQLKSQLDEEVSAGERAWTEPEPRRPAPPPGAPPEADADDAGAPPPASGDDGGPRLP